MHSIFSITISVYNYTLKRQQVSHSTGTRPPLPPPDRVRSQGTAARSPIRPLSVLSGRLQKNASSDTRWNIRFTVLLVPTTRIDLRASRGPGRAGQRTDTTRHGVLIGYGGSR